MIQGDDANGKQWQMLVENMEIKERQGVERGENEIEG